MHNYIVNASIQVLPIDQQKKAYDWVDEAISVIEKSNVKYEVGPFATVLEGSYNEVMGLIHEVNEYLYKSGCPEWITSLQIQIRGASDIIGEEKTAKFKSSPKGA
jgi:uncharacterized protein (TIGR00106 family)